MRSEDVQPLRISTGGSERGPVAPARLAVGHGNVVERPAAAMDAAIARAEGR